jgi:hypothetical protein
MIYSFVAKIWIYQGEGAWHFVTLPLAQSEEIKLITSSNRKSFGTVRVRAKIGGTSWKTSLFPEKKSGCYVLPISKPIRKSESIIAEDKIEVKIEIIETNLEKEWEAHALKSQRQHQQENDR